MAMQAFIEEHIEVERNPRYHRQRGRLMSDLLARYTSLEQTSFADLLMMLDKLKRHQAAIRRPPGCLSCGNACFVAFEANDVPAGSPLQMKALSAES